MLTLSFGPPYACGPAAAPTSACPYPYVVAEQARARGDEGLMVKAAGRSYVPNARTNVLKLKTEFVPGLGDTVTLVLVGARYARRMGSGASSGLVCELACAAPSAAAAAAAPSAAGPFNELVWLFNTADLSYSEHAGLNATTHEVLLRRLNPEILGGGAEAAGAGAAAPGSVMRKLEPGEPLPSWLLHGPTSKLRGMHFVLRDPARAVKVEVLGSRFLTRFTHDDEAVEIVPWKLRFPRIVRWFGEAAAAEATLPDTVDTYRRKGCEAWLAARGRSWSEIALELFRNGELSSGKDDERAPELAAGAADARGSHAALEPPEVVPASKRLRPNPNPNPNAGVQTVVTVQDQQVATETAMDTTATTAAAATTAAITSTSPSTSASTSTSPSTCGGGQLEPPLKQRLLAHGKSEAMGLTEAVGHAMPLNKAAFGEARGQRREAALQLYRRAARLFHASTANIWERFTQESFRKEQGLPSSALVEELKTGAVAYSGVARVLVEAAVAEKRRLRPCEVREALLMRLCARELYEDSYEYGELDELKKAPAPHNLETVRERVESLCKRDEVKDFLHGKLVEQMERFRASKKGRNWADDQLDLRPDE